MKVFRSYRPCAAWTAVCSPLVLSASAIAQTSTGSQVRSSGELPIDLSPWGMFLHADIIVQGVMVGLALASLLTWTIAVVKFAEMAVAVRASRQDIRVLSGARTLELAIGMAGGRGLACRMAALASTEIAAAPGPIINRDGVKERVAWSIERVVAEAGRTMSRGTGAVATVGATAPFVGLFGTVWGIMNSFIGISQKQTTNLAVVAPGIAEALLTTALGLAVAIPAVVIYNAYARSLVTYRALATDSATSILRLVSLELDRLAADGLGGSASSVVEVDNRP